MSAALTLLERLRQRAAAGDDLALEAAGELKKIDVLICTSLVKYSRQLAEAESQLKPRRQRKKDGLWIQPQSRKDVDVAWLSGRVISFETMHHGVLRRQGLQEGEKDKCVWCREAQRVFDSPAYTMEQPGKAKG